jgi:hypothetical protein
MGAAAAAIIIKREKDLVEHFRRAGATTPQAAQSPDELGVEDDNLIWRILVKGAVIRTGSEGRYYLDELSWEALGRRRRRLAVIMVAVLAAIAIAIFFAGTSLYVVGTSRR